MQDAPAVDGGAAARRKDDATGAPPRTDPARKDKARGQDDLVDASLRDAPILHKGDYPYLIHPLMDGVPRVDPALLRAWSGWAQAQGLLEEATVLLAPEAMALPLAAVLSWETGIPYVVARKRPYGLPGERLVPGATAYSRSTLHLNDIGPDDRVLIVDDVLSTGGTLESILDHFADRGASVCGVLVFVDKGGRAKRIGERFQVPVRVMRSIEVVDGKVRIIEG